MIQTVLNKLATTWHYILLIAGFAFLQTLVVSPIIHIEMAVIASEALIHAGMYAVLAVLLYNVIRYGKFEDLANFQQWINYTAVVLLLFVISGATTYTVYHAAPSNIKLLYVSYIPLRLFFSLCVLLLLVFLFRMESTRNVSKEILETTDENETTTEMDFVKPIQKETMEHVTVKSGQKINVVKVSDILCVQADGDYVHIHTAETKYMKEQTMKYFEEELSSNQFVRIHRSWIVNIHAIVRIELYEKQNQQVTLRNGFQIKTSQAGYKQLRQKLQL